MNNKIIIAVIASVVITTGVYAGNKIVSKDAVVIDGVGAVSFSDTQHIKNELKSYFSISEETIAIRDINNNVEEFSLEELGISIDIDGMVETLRQQQPREYNPLQLRFYFEPKPTFIVEPLYIYNKDKLRVAFGKSEILNPPIEAQNIESKDSLIVYNIDASAFQIEPEIYGNQVVEDCIDILFEAIKSVDWGLEINLEDINYYKKPKVYSANPTLISNLEILESRLTFSLELDLSKGLTRKIEPQDYLKFVDITYVEDDSYPKKINPESPFSIDGEAMDAFISQLNSEVTTMGYHRTFKTHNGENITIMQGDYGWWLHTEKTKEGLVTAMSGDGSERIVEAVWRQTANQHDGANDYGNTYVEISLAQQHLWYYRNGELVMETPVVTGNTNRGWATPKGIYSLTYKTRNATLTGPGYSTPVAYWMPFNRDVGMHDATWQPTFGGSRYLTNGSHGCINMPLAKAKELYGYLSSQHDPVIVY